MLYEKLISTYFIYNSTIPKSRTQKKTGLLLCWIRNHFHSDIYLKRGVQDVRWHSSATKLRLGILFVWTWHDTHQLATNKFPQTLVMNSRGIYPLSRVSLKHDCSVFVFIIVIYCAKLPLGCSAFTFASSACSLSPLQLLPRINVASARYKWRTEL